MTAYVAILLGAILASDQGGDPCERPEKDSVGIQIELKSSSVMKGNLLVGNFEIRNVSRDSVFYFNVVKDGSVNYVVRPEVSIEYLDLLGGWRLLGDLPGNYGYEPIEQRLPAGKVSSFSARLVSTEMATMNAREFRLLLRSRRLDSCVRSIPFHGVPARPQVRQLRSSDAP